MEGFKIFTGSQNNAVGPSGHWPEPARAHILIRQINTQQLAAAGRVKPSPASASGLIYFIPEKFSPPTSKLLVRPWAYGIPRGPISPAWNWPVWK